MLDVLRSRLPHLPRAMVVAVLTGVGAAILVAIALGNSAPLVIRILVALVGGATIGLIAAGYAALGSENEED